MSFKGVLIMVFFAVALLGVFVLSGCCEKQPAPGPAENAGAALDKAMDKTGDAAKDLADKANVKIKEAAEKAGEVLEKAGAAIEKSGSDMKDGNP